MGGKSGEFDLIAKYFAPLAVTPGALALTDDAALISPPPAHELVVTTDTLISGVHFLADDPPGSVAAKILAVNLSDLAAMGAVPHAYTLAVAWPRALSEIWIAEFAAGLERAQTRGRIGLAGGDTVATEGPLTLSVTAFGFVESGKAMLRRGAADGNDVYVSGTIGDGAAGLFLSVEKPAQVLNDGDTAFLISRYREPSARTEIGIALAEVATAAIDISDGLVADLGHLAAASGVDMTIRAADIPTSDALARLLTEFPELRPGVYAGGDDYELAFTAPSAAADKISAMADAAGVPLTKIGICTSMRGENGTVDLVDADENSIDTGKGGYEHF